jgi:hypothetical protein
MICRLDEMIDGISDFSVLWVRSLYIIVSESRCNKHSWGDIQRTPDCA